MKRRSFLQAAAAALIPLGSAFAAPERPRVRELEDSAEFCCCCDCVDVDHRVFINGRPLPGATIDVVRKEDGALEWTVFIPGSELDREAPAE